MYFKLPSITEITLIVSISIPASSVLERWVVWGQSTTNKPTLTKEVNTSSNTHGITIDNKSLAFSVPSGETAPVKNLRFTSTNRPIVRGSSYSLTVAGETYISTTSPYSSGLEVDGNVLGQAVVYSGIGPLDIKSTSYSYLETNYIEINTRLTNNAASDVVVDEFSINLEIPHDWKYIKYSPDLAVQRSSPTATSGLVVTQTSYGYTVVADGTTTLLNYSGEDGAPAGDYSGWLAAVSKNQQWYVALVPNVINRGKPRTLKKIVSTWVDTMINTATTIPAGATKVYTTFVVVDVMPLDVDTLKNMPGAVNGDIFTGVSAGYLANIGIIDNPPTEFDQPVIP